MKKNIVVISILCSLTITVGIIFIRTRSINLFDTQPISNQFDNIMENEQVYYNLFITMLDPYVEEAIADYYSEYMTYAPNAAPYDYKFTSIEKAYGLNYSYTVELEVHPYVGPHLSVGRDRITFKIELDGVYVDNFEHLKSYELPSRYQNIIKKKLPNI